MIPRPQCGGRPRKTDMQAAVNPILYLLRTDRPWQAQDCYAGVWWLNAAGDPGAESWGEVEQGLVALGDHFVKGLAQAQDRGEAARYALDFLAQGGFSKPWLLIFDNVDNDVLVAQGNLPDALAAYKAALAIAERLAKADPENAGWQRDLSVSHEKIGDVLVAQGNLPDALAAYKAALAIAERLAKADPENAGWQRDLAISNERLGDICLQQENPVEARQAFERALGAYEALITRNQGDVPSQLYSVVPRWRLSRLDPKNARRYLEAALAILTPLAAQTLNRRVRWLQTSETH
jgi:predicted negative regulator of RcsB-dependent stress response